MLVSRLMAIAHAGTDAGAGESLISEKNLSQNGYGQNMKLVGFLPFVLGQTIVKREEIYMER